VRPGEVYEYEIQILATANLFKAGHRICLDITSMDVPTGTGAMTNVEYIPYHICCNETVTHQIYHDAQRPSHLLVPAISNRHPSGS
jgi:predicted acyl esterase